MNQLLRPLFGLLLLSLVSFPASAAARHWDGENAWTDQGVKTDNAFVDARPHAAANKPEVRRYRQIYVKNDQPVGLWSDVVSVTVQP